MSITSSFYLLFFPCPGPPVAFSCHVPLVSFNLEEFLGLSLCLLNLTFLKSLGRLFCRMTLLKFCCCFLMICFRLCIFGKITTKGMLYLSRSITWRGTQYPFSHLVVMLSPITWFRRCVPNSPTVKLRKLKSSCGRIL